MHREVQTNVKILTETYSEITIKQNANLDVFLLDKPLIIETNEGVLKIGLEFLIF